MPPKRKRGVSASDKNKSPTKKQKLISPKSTKLVSKLDAAKTTPKKLQNNEESMESSWSHYMPPEILFRIFTINKFNTQDLRRASQVCWSWNACLKDEAFGWATIINLPLSIIWDGKFLLENDPFWR